ARASGPPVRNVTLRPAPSTIRGSPHPLPETAMSMLRTTTLAAAALLSAGCYHATVTTGATPSAVEVIDEPFASGWIYGLVPPKTVEAAEKCTSGVAKVETRQSFVNGLVG